MPARRYVVSPQGGGGFTLLSYLRTLGAGGAGVLSGQTANNYSATPLDAISYGTGGSGSSNATFPTITVGTPGVATGLCPAIINLFTHTGADTDPSGSGNNFYYSIVTNAPPNDWLSLAIAAQAAGCIVDLVIAYCNPAGNGNNPWTYGGGVLTNGSATNTTFLGQLAALVPSLKQLTRPWIFSPPGELNLTGASFNYNSTWMGTGLCTSGQSSALTQLVASYLVSQGVRNFLLNFEVNNESGQAAASFGDPGAACRDLVSIDQFAPQTSTSGAGSTPTLALDTATMNYLLGLDQPLCVGSTGVVRSDYSIISDNFSQNLYSQIFYPATQQYPQIFAIIEWSQGVSFNLQNGAVSCLSGATAGVAPFLSRTNLPNFTAAGGNAGG